MGSLTPGQVVFETLLRMQDEAVAARRRKADMAEACRMGFGADPEVLQRFLNDNRG